MSSNPFPQGRVLIEDIGQKLGLPGDKKAFVRFNFIESKDSTCAIINRVVLGQDRVAVGQFHDSHLSVIPAPRRAASSSQVGFGPIVVLNQNGQVMSIEDQFIMISDVQPNTEPTIATRVVIADDSDVISETDQERFQTLQRDCTAAMNKSHQSRLEKLRAKASSRDAG